MGSVMKRNKLVLVLLCAGVLVSILTAVATALQRNVLVRGTAAGFPAADLPDRVPALGINADLTIYNEADLSENADLMSKAGFVWIRQSFDWSAIEPENDRFDWHKYDSIVSAAAENNLRIVAVLEKSPAWAADALTAPPASNEEFYQFARALAERYQDQIDVYQVWDEPNLGSGWGDSDPAPARYAALLEAGYRAIHGADPESLVLTASLAPTIETGPENLSDIVFLRALYENGASEFFDGVSAKAYGFDSGPEDRRIHHNRLNFSRVILLREEMVEFGDANKPLWIGNFGWNSLPPGWEGNPSVWGQTSPDQQTRRTLDAYERVLKEWSWAGGVILENWQPDAPAFDPRWGFALRSIDGDLSPLFTALQQVSDEYNSGMWPGVYPANTSLADYSGEWEFSDLGADIVENGSSAVNLPFYGDTLSVIVRRDQYRAHLYVTIDGEPSSSLPRDDTGAYLILTSPDYKPRIETMAVATRLDADQLHLAHIEAERGWDQWAIVGYVVGMRDVRLIQYEIAVFALVILAVLLVAVIVYQTRNMEITNPLTQFVAWATVRLGSMTQFGLTLITALALWIGAALTWGGLLPDVFRRLGDGPSLLLTALTAGFFYFSPWLILTLASLVLLFLLIYAKPVNGVALIAFFAPFYYLPRPLFDRAFSMAEIVSLLTLLAWAIHVAAMQRHGSRLSPRNLWKKLTGLDKAIGLFVAVAAASLLWSDLLGVAITELRQVIIEPLAGYLVLRTLSISKRERWLIVDMLILTGLVIAIVGFVQMLSGSGLITAEGGIPRLKSVYNSPNSVALFLGRVIPITFAVLLAGDVKLRRFLYSTAGVIMLVAAVLSLSKGGLLLGIPAAFAVVIILWAGRKGFYAVIGGILLEIIALIPLSRIPRFSGLLDFSSGTSTSFFRLQLWKSAIRLIREHPITGVGLDQFLYAYRGRYILPDAWQEPDLSTPHTILLNFWVRLGIAGVVAAVWMQVEFWKLGWRIQRKLRGSDGTEWALTAGLMGGMAAFLAHGLVDEPFFLIDLAYVFFIALGLMHLLSDEIARETSD